MLNLSIPPCLADMITCRDQHPARSILQLVDATYRKSSSVIHSRHIYRHVAHVDSSNTSTHVAMELVNSGFVLTDLDVQQHAGGC
jgi:hypothetical protein